MNLSLFHHESPEEETEMNCMCDPKYSSRPGKRLLSHDFLSLFLEKNSDGTKNLRLKGNELFHRINRRIEDGDAENISEFILKYPEIIKVDLSYNPLMNRALVQLTDIVFKQPNRIEHLNLTGCDIGAVGITRFLDAWITLRLKTLRLTGNKFGTEPGAAFFNFLTNNSTLEQLDIADTDQTIISIPFFAGALRVDIGYNQTLKALDLSNVIPISKYYQAQPKNLAEHLSTMLKMNNTLIELHIQKCGLDGHDVEILMIGLQANQTLELLDLGYNKIGNFGAEKLSEWFQTGPNIVGVNIAGNSIGEFGGRAISFGLPYTKIRLFDISGNKISDAGLSELLLSIKKTQRIRLFYMFGNEIGPLSKEVLERQLLAGVYDLSNIDFQMFRTSEGLQIAHRECNDYKHLLYNQLERADVQELRIRRNILPGPYCETHTKLHFMYYDKLPDPKCVEDPRYDPSKVNEEEMRKRCAEKEEKRRLEEERRRSRLRMQKRRSRSASRRRGMSLAQETKEDGSGLVISKMSDTNLMPPRKMRVTLLDDTSVSHGSHGSHDHNIRFSVVD